jgi:hypothetical protein
VTFGAVLRHLQILLDTERWKHATALRHQPHPAANGGERSTSGDVRTLEKDFSTPGRREADDRIDQRGLADTVAAEQADNLALLELQRDALQHIGVAVIGMDVLDVQNDHESAGPQINLLHLYASADAFGLPAFQHLAEMQNRNVVGDTEDDVHVVLDQEDRDSRVEFLQKLCHLR